MILEIVKYGHPVLREKGKRISTITPEIRQLAADMLETMRANEGVGLAAQQVGRALQLTVVDATVTDRPSAMFVNNLPVSLVDHMPLTLINPVIRKVGTVTEIGPEGCLSFPEISADISRASRLVVETETLEGKVLKFECTGLLARAIQHEVDHLNGILFIDRMDSAVRTSLSGKLKRLQKESSAYGRKQQPNGKSQSLKQEETP